MRQSYFRFLWILINVLIVTEVGTEASVRAADPGQYDYPELSIVPRATDRLKFEASREPQRKWNPYFPMQVAGLSTILSGIASYDAKNSGIYIGGIGIGGAWLLLTTLMAVNYTPYLSAHNDIARLPKGTIREQLTRERAADEQIRSIASLGEKLRWLSVASNLGMSVAMAAQSYNEPLTGIATTRRGFQAASIVLAFAPLLFRPYWKDVAEEQGEYKKRIYAPVANLDLLFDSGTRTYVPGLHLALSF